MDLGVVYWATDQTIEPADFAVAVEERGFESCFVGEHTHVPTTWKTADTSGLPDHDGSEPPLLGSPEYKRFLDPFVALSVAAAATTRIQLGTSVCLVAQHDPILLAKTVATLDHLSRGRVILGIGFGWNEREMANHRIDFRLRHAIVREKVAAMRRLWSDEVASYEGRYVSISPSWSWPKPVRQIPVLIGGDGPVAIRHAVEYGDGWIPVAGKVVEKMRVLQHAAREAGRNPHSIPVTVTSPRPSREALEHYREAGVKRVILWVPPPCDRDHALRTLDEWASFVPVVA